MGRLKIVFRAMGLSNVNWDKYDFHITPVLTFTKVQKENSCGWCLSLEWGHWAVWAGLFSIK